MHGVNFEYDILYRDVRFVVRLEYMLDHYDISRIMYNMPQATSHTASSKKPYCDYSIDLYTIGLPLQCSFHRRRISSVGLL